MLEEQALALEVLARAASVDLETRLAAGDYAAQVAAEVGRRPYAAVYWLCHNRSFIARFFLGDDEGDVVRTAPGPDGAFAPDAFRAG